MKSAIKTLALFASLAFAASSAFGIPTVVLTPGLITESPQYYGGEFTATSATLSNSSYAASARSGAGFETFCMAYDQEFSYGDTLGYTLTNHTDDPGVGSIQALTSGTAWLYSQFAQGNLVLSTGVQDTALQMAIWWLQQSNGAPGIGAYNSSNYYENLVVGALGSANVMTAAGANNHGVSIILTEYDNAAGSFNRYAQPQLYYHAVPDQGTTLVLLGLAFLGLAGVSRKIARAR